GFPRRTGVDWLAWLADQARESELFRRDLVRGDGSGGEAKRAAQERALADAAMELVRSLSPAEFLARRERLTPPARHAPVVAVSGVAGGHETDGMDGTDGADGIDGNRPGGVEAGSVVCITHFAPEFTASVGGENVVVLAGGRKLTIRRKARPALEALLGG